MNGFYDANGAASTCAIRVGARSCSLRLAEIAALVVDRRIVRFPTRSRSVLGLANVRGVPVPVHSLACLLGEHGDASPRWIVLARAAPVAFAFEAFEGASAIDDAARTALDLGEWIAAAR